MSSSCAEEKTKTTQDKPILAISGEARLCQQIVQLSASEPGSDRPPEIKVLRDFYLPTGTYLLEAILDAALNESRAEQLSEQFLSRFDKVKEIARSVEGETAPRNEDVRSRLQAAFVPTQVENHYDVRGPKDRKDHSNETIFNLPGDKVIVSPRQEKRGAEKTKVFRIADFLGKKGRQAQPAMQLPKHNDRIAQGEYPSAYVHVIAIDFDQFGRPSTPASKNTAAIPCLRKELGIADHALPHLHNLVKKNRGHFVIKCRNLIGWKGRDCPANAIARRLARFLDPHLDRSTGTEEGPDDEDHNRWPLTSNAVIILSAEELRYNHKAISYQVSWERTIQSTLATLRAILSEPGDDYHFIARASHIVVTFGCDGALYVNQKDREFLHAYCVIDPLASEGDLVRRFAPRMAGFDSAVTAGIAHCLMELSRRDKPDCICPENVMLAINQGMIRGLKAARLLQIHGFVELSSDEMQRLSKPFVRSHELGELHLPFRYAQKWADEVCDLYFKSRPHLMEAYRKAVLLPLDLLGAVLWKGSIDYRSWFPVPAPISKPSEEDVEPLRKFGSALQRDWKDAGWFHSHYFDYTDLQTILRNVPRSPSRRKVRFSDAPYFDRTWWSFLGTFLVCRELLPSMNTVREHPRKTVARVLGHKVLKYGLDWLQSDHRKKQDELLTFFSSTLQRLWPEQLNAGQAEDEIPLGKKNQIAIVEKLRQRLRCLLGVEAIDEEMAEASKERGAGYYDGRPLDLLVRVLIRRQEAQPELPTLLGVGDITESCGWRNEKGGVPSVWIFGTEPAHAG